MNKKDISIHKKKTDYKDGFECLNAKEILFDQLTIQEFINELSNNNIKITIQDIKNNYEKYHNIETVINIYYDMYTKEFKALDDKMELFDEDSLYFLCNQYIMENYYPTQLFDPNYIEDLIDEYDENKDSQLLLNIIRNVNGISQYHKSKDLDVLFEGCMFDIENYIVECPMEILNMSLPKEEAVLLVKEFRKFIDTYKIDEYNQVNIYRDLIEILARYGLKEVQELLEYALKKYPDDKQSIYLSLLFGLEESQEVENMKLYYQKAIQLMPISSLDIDNREILIENFSHLKD
ncbi:MAG: hypothetical protein RR630_06995 [Coprobacillus sp.]